MTARHLRYVFILLLGSGCLFVVSQNRLTDKKGLLLQYNRADKLYHQALQISASVQYDEAKEIALNRQALQAFLLLDQQFTQQAFSYDSLHFFIQFKIGELQHYFESTDSALVYYHRSIETKKQVSSLPDSLLFRPHLFAGIIHYSRNHLDSAIYFLQAAEYIKQQYRGRLNDEERLYNNLGALYYSTGNFRQAKNYFQKAADVLPKNHPYYEDLLVNYYINLASALTTLEEYDEANSIYQKILGYGNTTNVILHNIGIINLNLGAAEKALSYFRKVQYNSNRLVSLYNDMGLAHFNLNHRDSAFYYYQKAIEANGSWNKQNTNVAHGLSLKNLGDLFKEREPIKALQYYQQALHQFYPAFRKGEMGTNPESFSGLFSYINLFQTLSAKAEALHQLYQGTKKIEWAEDELWTYLSAFKLIDYVERSYDSDEARLFLNNIKYVVHNKPIDIAYELFLRTGKESYLHEAYLLDQENKASVLSLHQQLQSGLKDSTLLGQERKLRTEITRLNLTASRGLDSVQLENITEQIREKEIALGKVQEKIADASPLDLQKIPSINDVQNLLDKKGALISYHLSDTALLRFIITKNTFEVSRKPFHKEEVMNIITSLRSPDAGSNTSTGMYHSLFDELPLKNISNLVIIPDDELNYLPFESLMDATNQYLVQRFSIQYQYTTALLKKQKSKPNDTHTLAIAPFSNEGYSYAGVTLQQLAFSANEIAEAKGKQLNGRQATKQGLMNNLNGKSIIHFATHAQINSDTSDLSYIALAPDDDTTDAFLYAAEIYNLPLAQTDLVILSACETGAGSLQKGEGVMSLSRAFAYAGCPNVITSLWKADDESTAYIIKRFYHHLRDEHSIAVALRLAKKDYLSDKNIHPRKKHPAYWAHLVFAGNYAREDSNYWWMISIPIALLLIMFIKKSRRKQDRNVS